MEKLMFHLDVKPETRETELYENADYVTFWQGVQQQKLDELEQRLVRQMLHLPSRRLLDVGCGYGRLLDTYLAQSTEVVLLDSSHSLLQQAYARTGGRALCIACDLHHLPFPAGVFDQVMMVRVFHHLPDSVAALTELGRVLGPGRNLLFSYCNKKNLERVVRWLLGKNPYHPFRREPAWVWEIFYMHHPRQVESDLQTAGFSLQSVRGAGVVDKLAGILGRAGRRFPPGAALAPLLGRLALAPWIFCDAWRSGEAAPLPETPVADLLICPDCQCRLEHLVEGWRCPRCDKFFTLQAGVLNFL